MPDTKQETYNALLGAFGPLSEAKLTLEALAARINRGTGGREVALAITKVQEATHWLNEAGDRMTEKE